MISIAAWREDVSAVDDVFLGTLTLGRRSGKAPAVQLCREPQESQSPCSELRCAPGPTTGSFFSGHW